MNYEEWMTSLDLPSEVGVSTSEAFQAGQDYLKAHIKQLWLETDTYDEFAYEVKLLAGIDD